MTVEARLNSTWLYKWLLMALFLFGFGLYCIYDATVAYPDNMRRAQEFSEYQAAGNLDEWPQYAQTQGWDVGEPAKTPEEIKTDIATQWVMLAILWGLMAMILVWVGIHYNRKLVADETHLQGPRGQRVPYEAITSIDKERWDSKGIAIVHYEMDGRAGKIKLDDWVFRDADLVLEEVQTQTGLGGPLPV